MMATLRAGALEAALLLTMALIVVRAIVAVAGGGQ